MSYPKTRRGGGGGERYSAPLSMPPPPPPFYQRTTKGSPHNIIKLEAKKLSLAPGHCPVLQPSPRACLSYVSSGKGGRIIRISVMEARGKFGLRPKSVGLAVRLLRNLRMHCWGGGGEGDTEEGTPPFHIPLFVVCRLRPAAAGGKLKSLKSLEPTYLKHFSGQNCYTNLPPPPKIAPKIFILIRFDGKSDMSFLRVSALFSHRVIIGATLNVTFKYFFLSSAFWTH